MSWSVEHTDEFAHWWAGLSDAQQKDATAVVLLLIKLGPQLPFPYSSGIKGSKHAQMRELRVQSGGRPIRIFYAFDPRRSAILLIGGDKTGDGRFYERLVPIADAPYDVYLIELKKRGIDPMTGHRPFNELIKSFTPARRARVAAKAAALQEEMTLEEIRKARGLSQEEIAATLEVGQPAVAKVEKRSDMHVSNLRRYVEALGGTLEITARFPDASVVIEAVGETAPAAGRR
jgi:DNA-binding XRE family transcriptional regulator